MIFNLVVMSVVFIFIFISLIDEVFFKSRFGLYPKFLDGLNTIPPIALAITGIIVLVPVIALFISPLFSYVFGLIGADPSMGVGIFIANDMGGYQLALELSNDYNIGVLSGLVYSSMMGATLIFSIPVALAIISDNSLKPFVIGIIFGFISVPFGVLTGGLLLGIEIRLLVLNLIIPFLISILLSGVLVFYPNRVSTVFKRFSKLIQLVSYLGLVIGFGIEFVYPIINGLYEIPEGIGELTSSFNSIYDGLIVSGVIGVVLSGALPFLHVLNGRLNKLFKGKESLLGFSKVGILGLFATLANNIAMFQLLDEMDYKNKIVNVAFSVGAAFLIGDHLAFTAAVQPELIYVVVISKLSVGVIAVIISLGYLKFMEQYNVA